eukprot:5708780-Pleurochrysis_carterae.AAC.7
MTDERRKVQMRLQRCDQARHGAQRARSEKIEEQNATEIRSFQKGDDVGFEVNHKRIEDGVLAVVSALEDVLAKVLGALGLGVLETETAFAARRERRAAEVSSAPLPRNFARRVGSALTRPLTDARLLSLPLSLLVSPSFHSSALSLFWSYFNVRAHHLLLIAPCTCFRSAVGLPTSISPPPARCMSDIDEHASLHVMILVATLTRRQAIGKQIKK